MIDDIPISKEWLGPTLYDQYSEFNGYYCIQTAPFLCGCRIKPWTFVHFSSQIIVWEDKDEDTMLWAANEFKILKLDPHIVEYNAVMGACVDWRKIPAGAIIG